MIAAGKTYEKRIVIKKRGDGVVTEEDSVIREAPLTIMLNGEEFATLVCSPSHEMELVVGYLAGEGIIERPDDISDYSFREQQGVAWIETGSRKPRTDGFLRRNFTSCCGRGRPSLYFMNDSDQVSAVKSETVFPAGHILSVFDEFESSSATYHLTGGVHSAGLLVGSMIVARYEDIGRHNALDRIMGHVFLNGIRTSEAAILLSGRISSEMLVKTARIGAPAIISKSAPTTLALDFAERLGITVVGFVRGGKLNVYTHAERITGLC